MKMATMLWFDFLQAREVGHWRMPPPRDLAAVRMRNHHVVKDLSYAISVLGFLSSAGLVLYFLITTIL